MEQRIQGGKPLPEDMRHWEPLVVPFADRGARAEIRLAINEYGEPTDYWGKQGQPWIRGKLDCVVLNHSRAYMADWKTSAKPRENAFELQIGAMLLNASFPNLTTIIGTYVWLAHCDVGTVHDVSDVKDTFRKCVSIIQQIQQDATFEKRQGPLCSYCDVGDCEFNRKPK
jgi:hypothetical protein